MRLREVGIVALASCLGPTEIVLQLRTDVACSADQGVAVALGAPGDDDSGVSTVTHACDGEGGIGSLVVLPSGSPNDAIGIRVTLGVDAAADKCGPPRFDGCIVARRALRYDPHTPLTLPIDLESDCLGKFCDPSSTCFRGSCVDASVMCPGNVCNVPEAGSGCPVSPVLVHTPAVETTPRITQTAAGWLVAWLDTAGGASAASISSAGTPSTPFSLPVSSAQSLGSLGTNGTTFALTYATGGGTFGVVFDATGVVQGTPHVAGNALPGLSGMFAVGSEYGTGLVQATVPNVVTFSPAITFTGMAGLTDTNVSNLSIAEGQGLYYASFSDSTLTCFTYTCSYGAGAFSCTSSTMWSPQGCLAVRWAARSTSDEAQAFDVAGNAYAGVQNLGTVDSPDALAILPTSTRYHVLFLSKGTLYDAWYDGTSVTAVNPIASALAFDAVPDGPSQPGFAVVYTAAGSPMPSVNFVHMCE